MFDAVIVDCNRFIEQIFIPVITYILTFKIKKKFENAD